MNQDSPDRNLAQLFERQRDEDRRAAPSFTPMQSAAASSARRARGRPSAVRLVLAASVVGAVILGVQHGIPHARDRANDSVATAEAMISWQSPTDWLLVNYADPGLASVTVTGAAWSDALISPANAMSNLEL